MKIRAYFLVPLIFVASICHGQHIEVKDSIPIRKYYSSEYNRFFQLSDSISKFSFGVKLPSHELNDSLQKNLSAINKRTFVRQVFGQNKDSLRQSSKKVFHELVDGLPSCMDSLYKKSFIHKITGHLDSLDTLDRTSINSRLIKDVIGGQEIGARGLATAAKKEIEKIKAKAPSNLVKFESGFIHYNWNYRSGLDSPFTALELSQHQITSNADFTLAGKLPISFNYYGRRTNSEYFKNYHDFTVEIDVQRFRELRTHKVLDHLKGYTDKLRDPMSQQLLGSVDRKLRHYKNILQHPTLISEVIKSTETLARSSFSDTASAYKDSIYCNAKGVLQFFDSVQKLQQKYVFLKDSLQKVIQSVESKIKKIEQLTNRRSLTLVEQNELAAVYGENNKYIQKLYGRLSGVKKLALGRSYPNYSPLTLQNVNVNGLNIEYNQGNLYVAAVAGMVDFRIRDFLFANQSKVPQYIYLGRVGYGNKDRNHVILSYFSGRKQLLGSTSQSPSIPVQGMTLFAQFYINKTTKLYGELAQSMSRSIMSVQKPSQRFSDPAQKAYAMGFTSTILKTKTRLEGFYEYKGSNYQSFNSFQYNSTTAGWSGKLEQPLWNRQFILLAAVRKNDFNNPELIQRYNANTVFKSLKLSFQKPKWPRLSVAYLPVSQNTIIGNHLYENYFQSFTGNISYNYNLGEAMASSALIYNKFYNESIDSSFLYYNAHNFFWNQHFVFKNYSAGISASVLENSQHLLYILEGSVNTMINKAVNIDLVIKVNTLNKKTTGVGYRTGCRFVLNRIGEISIYAEKSYLPNANNGLYKYEIYNLGFTRYFK